MKFKELVAWTLISTSSLFGCNGKQQETKEGILKVYIKNGYQSKIYLDNGLAKIVEENYRADNENKYPDFTIRLKDGQYALKIINPNYEKQFEEIIRISQSQTFPLKVDLGRSLNEIIIEELNKNNSLAFKATKRKDYNKAVELHEDSIKSIEEYVKKQNLDFKEVWESLYRSSIKLRIPEPSSPYVELGQIFIQQAEDIFSQIFSNEDSNKEYTLNPDKSRTEKLSEIDNFIRRAFEMYEKHTTNFRVPLEEGINLYPTKINLFYKLGIIYRFRFMMGKSNRYDDYKKAIFYFEKELSYNDFLKEDGKANIHLNIGNCYLDIQDKYNAKKELEMVIEKYPKTKWANMAKESLEKLKD